MKYFVIAALSLFCATSQSQTYSLIALTNFVGSGSSYVATTNITVPAGTTVTMVGDFFSKNIGISSASSPTRIMTVQYAGGPATYPDGDNNVWVSEPVLGPCTLTLTAVANNNNNAAAYAVLKSWTTNIYSLIALTNFTGSGSSYVATTNITVPAGTTVTMVGDFFSKNIGISSASSPTRIMTVQYAGGPVTYPDGDNNVWVSEPVLGPCTLTLTAVATNNSAVAYAVLQTTK